MGPVSAFTSFFNRYFDVHGRSRRSEFGWMLIIQIVAFIVIGFSIAALEGGAEGLEGENMSFFGIMLNGALSLVWIGTLIPWLTLTIRRFHDMNLSGWLVAFFAGLWIIPPIGMIGHVVQFIWVLFGSGTPGVNTYGQDPRFSRGLEYM